MEIVLLMIGIAALIALLLYQRSKARQAGGNATPAELKEEYKTQESELTIQGSYKKRWLFSYNEKDAYWKLKQCAEELGWIVLAKVRLLDLLEPVKGIPKYKTYFYKIQSKHVDFVLCDQKLVAKYIVELDDQSHDLQHRKDRDRFVDEVVKSVGYEIIHIRGVAEDFSSQIKPANQPQSNPPQTDG